jgi:hypothetical protein
LYSDYFGYHFTCCHSSSSSSSSSLPAPAIVLSLLLPGAEADAISPDPRSSSLVCFVAPRDNTSTLNHNSFRALFSITLPGHAQILLIGTFLFSTSTPGLDPAISANGKKTKIKNTAGPIEKALLLFENKKEGKN